MIRSIRSFLFPFFLFHVLFFVPLLCAEEPHVSVKVEVDRAFATIGDRINLRVTIRHDPEVSVLEIDPGHALRDFEIKQATNFSSEDGKIQLEGKNYVITSYLLGEYVVQSFPVRYRAKGGEVQELKTNSLYITIQSVDEKKDPNSDIRGVKGTFSLKRALWPWMVLIGALGAGGLAGWIWYAERRKKLLSLAAEALLSPHDEAYQALNRLRHSDLIRKGQVKLYFFQMTEILKRYFERRYYIRALEATTFELTKDLKEKVAEDDWKLANEVFQFSDMVKFAKYIPQPQEIAQHHGQAMNLIDRTKEPEPQTISEPVKP